MAAPTFVKFPRTRHVLDAGGSGVARDDLLMTPVDARVRPRRTRRWGGAGPRVVTHPAWLGGVQAEFFSGQVVSCEEKVDGANLGFSLDENGAAGANRRGATSSAAHPPARWGKCGPGVIRAQNRSHFVNGATHPQFKALDAWIAQHAADLYTLLQDGDRILFGEWLYAQHSIAYTALPNYFLAFDLFDRRTGAFLPRAARDAALAATAIPAVPLLQAGPLRGPADLLALLETNVRGVRCCLVVLDSAAVSRVLGGSRALATARWRACTCGSTAPPGLCRVPKWCAPTLSRASPSTG